MLCTHSSLLPGFLWRLWAYMLLNANFNDKLHTWYCYAEHTTTFNIIIIIRARARSYTITYIPKNDYNLLYKDNIISRYTCTPELPVSILILWNVRDVLLLSLLLFQKHNIICFKYIYVSKVPMPTKFITIMIRWWNPGRVQHRWLTLLCGSSTLCVKRTVNAYCLFINNLFIVCILYILKENGKLNADDAHLTYRIIKFLQLKRLIES